VFFINCNKLDKSQNKKFLDYFLIAQELVYASAGIFILLMEKDKNLIAPIAIAYAFLVYVSSTNSSIDGSKSEWKIYFYNVSVVIIILAVTIISFSWFLPSYSVGTGNGKTVYYDTTRVYTVVIPYTDNTLKKNIGRVNLGERQFFYSIDIKADNKDIAIEQAKASFYESSLTKPIYPKLQDVEQKISQDDKKIIVNEQINLEIKK
jgi:hypothetical protein